MNLKKRFAAAVATVGVSLSLVPAVANAQPELPQLPPLPAPPAPPALPGNIQLPPLPDNIPLPPLPPGPNLSAPPQVNQDVNESYVSFGDSLAANPTMLDIAVSRYQRQHPEFKWPTIRDGFCAQGPNNFPSQTAQKTGLRLADYSCGGATAYVPSNPGDPIPHTTLTQQVDQAIGNGDLDGRTRLVSLSIGVNDLWQPGNGENVGQAERNRLYHETVTSQLQRIKAAAPNAKVILVGVPDQTDGANHTCATNLLGVTSHWYYPIVPYYQDELRNQQRSAAEAEGVQFLDMADEISAASGKNGCSNDPNRLSAAIFDDAPHNFTFHLTDAGHVYYSDRLTQEYRA